MFSKSVKLVDLQKVRKNRASGYCQDIPRQVFLVLKENMSLLDPT